MKITMTTMRCCVFAEETYIWNRMKRSFFVIAVLMLATCFSNYSAKADTLNFQAPTADMIKAAVKMSGCSISSAATPACEIPVNRVSNIFVSNKHDLVSAQLQIKYIPIGDRSFSTTENAANYYASRFIKNLCQVYGGAPRGSLVQIFETLKFAHPLDVRYMYPSSFDPGFHTVTIHVKYAYRFNIKTAEWCLPKAPMACGERCAHTQVRIRPRTTK